MQYKNSPRLTVLGGGPAGLAVSYYAKKRGIPFTLYEASSRLGGNAITLQRDKFFFDSGAHRLHDKHPEITQELLTLLGQDLKKIEIPSLIYHNRKFIDFPLSPLNLLTKLGPVVFFRAGIEFLKAQLDSKPLAGHFKDIALKRYGRTIAERFLLNYTEKLWGMPCEKLSPAVSGSRIKGLNFTTFLKEALFGHKAKTAHLDGSFYYPKKGIGMIADKLGEYCGAENIKKNSRITRIFHRNKRIHTIEINGNEVVPVDEVVSTLPNTLFLKLLDPTVPENIASVARKFRFRDVKLVVLCLKKESITNSGSVYFPDREHFFTAFIIRIRFCLASQHFQMIFKTFLFGQQLTQFVRDFRILKRIKIRFLRTLFF